MLPFDSFYETKHAMGTSGSSVVFSVPDGETWTIISALVERSDKSPHTYLTAGGKTFFIHTGADFAVHSEMVQPITGDVVLNWSGATTNTHHFTAINYVKYDLKKVATTTQQSYNPHMGVATSTDVQVYGSISAGEMVLTFLIFMLLLIEMGKIIARGLDKINTRRKFIRYQNADTEVTDDLI